MRINAFNDFSNPVPKVADGSLCGFSQEGFQLGERLFYGIEVRAVWRREHQPRARGFDYLTCRQSFVTGKIVENNDIAWLQCRSENLADINLEPFPIDRSVNDKGCDHPCVSHSGNKRRCLAMTVWEVHSQPIAQCAWRAYYEISGLSGHMHCADRSRADGRPACRDEPESVSADKCRDKPAMDDSFYPLLGYKIGTLTGFRIPLIEGLAGLQPTFDALKAFGAAFATVSSVPMFHIAGVTPDARSTDHVLAYGNVECIRLTLNDLFPVWKELNSATSGYVELVSLGNPHFSFDEMQKLAALCNGRKKNANVGVVVTTARTIYDKAKSENLVEQLEAFGVQFVTDTCWCMISDPIIPPAAKTIMTNSGKYAHYGPGIAGRKFHFGGLSDCVDTACRGFRKRTTPCWMPDIGHNDSSA